LPLTSAQAVCTQGTARAVKGAVNPRRCIADRALAFKMQKSSRLLDRMEAVGRQAAVVRAFNFPGH